MDETKRWSEGVVGFGSGSDPAQLMERMHRDLRGLHGLHGLLTGDAHAALAEPEIPKAPVLNRRQRRELARRGRRRSA